MLSTKYRDLSPRAKDRIYKQFQRLKVKKDIVRNRSFYSKEDYIPVPVADVAKIMKALNDSLSPSYPRVQFSKHNPNFLYDFLKVIKEATAQGIEDDLPKEVQGFYNSIILPIIMQGKLKSKVKNLLSNLHDPLFTSDKMYNWMRLDYPMPVVIDELEEFPTALHYYYAELCSDQRLRDRFYSLDIKEIPTFIKGCQKRGIFFRHNFDVLVSAFYYKMRVQPYRSMLVNTGNRPICYIDKDSYFGVLIRNNGTPSPYLQTAYRNLKVGQNKAGQAIMEVRYLYETKRACTQSASKPCSKKRDAVKTFLKKLSLQLKS